MSHLSGILKNSLSDNTSLVSIMFANNEVGTIEPIAQVAQICNERNIPFHTDAVQAVGKIPIDVKKLGVDLLSISSHKINGPKGIGALYFRKGIDIDPIILGGGQEHGLRSGTENVASIVGFGKACELAKHHLSENISHMKKLRDELVAKTLREISSVTLNGHIENRLPDNAHFTFLGVTGEDLIIKLDEYGIAASTGSACSVHTQKASHVLQAMGFSHEQITGSLRLTLGLFNNQEQIDETINSFFKPHLSLTENHEMYIEKFLNELRTLPDFLIYFFLGLSAFVENLVPPIPGDTITAFGASWWEWGS